MTRKKRMQQAIGQQGACARRVRSLSIPGRRLCGAISIVGMLVLFAPISSWVMGMQEEGPMRVKDQTPLVQAGVATAQVMDDPQAMLNEIDARLDSVGTGSPSPDFLDEIGLLENVEELRADETGQVVGYAVPGDEEQVFHQVEESFQKKGWTGTPLGAAVGATFQKKDGSCRWAMVTCTQVGPDTSVVVRTVEP